MKKRVISVLLAGVLACSMLGATGCGSKGGENENPIRVERRGRKRTERLCPGNGYNGELV